MKKNRVFSFLLALCLIAGLLPGVACAAGETVDITADLLTTIPNNYVLHPGQSITLTANLTGAEAGKTYLYTWYKGGTILVGETSKTLTIKSDQVEPSKHYTVSVLQQGAIGAGIPGTNGIALDVQDCHVGAPSEPSKSYALLGRSYSRQIDGSSCGTPIRYAVETGSALPPGLSLSTDGVLSGTPTQLGSFTTSIKLASGTPAAGFYHHAEDFITVSTVVEDPDNLPMHSITVYREDGEGNRVAGAVLQLEGGGAVVVTGSSRAAGAALQLNGGVYTAVTDSNGVAVLRAPRGIYTITERTAPFGYVKSDQAFYHIRVLDDGVSMRSPTTDGYVAYAPVTFIGAKLPTTRFPIYKTTDTGAPLAGAVFQLLHKGTSVYTATSDVDGVAWFSAAYADYTLVEQTAPAGYAKSEETFALSVKDGAVTHGNADLLADQRLTVTNRALPPPPPFGGSYTLRFETNGGTAVAPITASEGSVMKLTQTSTKKDFLFAGWYLDRELSKRADSVTMNRDITVYALWQPIPELIRDDHFAYIMGYPDGTVKPDKNITRAEVAAIFFRLLKDKSEGVERRAYNDVNTGAWYGQALTVLSSRGIIRGYVDGSFRPEAPVTRGEFAAIASRFDNLSTGTKRFTDVSADHWAYADISSAAEKGWVSGYPGGDFRPEQSITRAEVAKIVNSVLGRSADKTAVERFGWLRRFPDLPVSHWSYYEIMEATNGHGFTRVDGAEKWEDRK